MQLRHAELYNAAHCWVWRITVHPVGDRPTYWGRDKASLGDSTTLQGGMGEVCAAAVEAANTTQGLHGARRLWRVLAAGPPPGGALFLAAAQIEAAAVLAGDAAADVTAAKAAFEAGIAAYGAEDETLMLEYVRFARAAPAAGISSSDLLRPGTRTLHDPAAFMLAFKQL